MRSKRSMKCPCSYSWIHSIVSYIQFPSWVIIIYTRRSRRAMPGTNSGINVMQTTSSFFLSGGSAIYSCDAGAALGAVAATGAQGLCGLCWLCGARNGGDEE